jgi:hypothetical protein
VKIFFPMMAATGKQLKQSMKVFHSLIVYLRLPVKKHGSSQSGYVGDGETWVKLERLTFVIKAVHLGYAGAFMVPSQEEKVERVFDLIREEQAYRFKGLFPSVDVVAKKKVICVRREATAFKNFEEVMKLTVDVTCSNDVRAR